MSKPRFINEQTGSVLIYDENRRPVTVQPYRDRDRKAKDAIYVVEGEHYRQFVNVGGPLATFPEPQPAAPSAPSAPDEPVDETADVAVEEPVEEVGGGESDSGPAIEIDDVLAKAVADLLPDDADATQAVEYAHRLLRGETPDVPEELTQDAPDIARLVAAHAAAKSDVTQVKSEKKSTRKAKRSRRKS